MEWLLMITAFASEDDVIIGVGLSKITGAGQDCCEAEEHGLFCNDLPRAVSRVVPGESVVRTE